jgi:hypothetical protein
MPSDDAKGMRWCATILPVVLAFLVGVEKSASRPALYSPPVPSA